MLSFLIISSFTAYSRLVNVDLMLLKVLLCFLLLLGIHSVARSEQINQHSSGDDATNIGIVQGDVVYKIYQIRRRASTKPLHVLDVTVPPFNENDADTTKLVQLFNELFKHDQEIIYIRFYTYVGGSVGLNSKMLSNYGEVRAGVVFKLDDWLDGFGGNRDNYTYGYVIESTDGSILWGSSRYSALLFPDKDNAFFDISYSSGMSFEGLAKIKISSSHGMSWIEIVPTLPVGDLKEAYDGAKVKLDSGP